MKSTTTTTMCEPEKDHHKGDQGDRDNEGDHGDHGHNGDHATFQQHGNNGHHDNSGCENDNGHGHKGFFIVIIIFIQHFCDWWANIFSGHSMMW